MSPSSTLWPQFDGAADPLLQRALERLDSMGELVLDFTGVRRIDPAALQAMEQLAFKASSKSARITLRGVNVQAYKVLKLSRMAAQFSFET
jgi:anti-anti-sigma regulatory factor